MSQLQMYFDGFKKIVAKQEVMLELLFGHNPITDDELRKSIARKPWLYAGFEGYLGTRVGDGGIYWGA